MTTDTEPQLQLKLTKVDEELKLKLEKTDKCLDLWLCSAELYLILPKGRNNRQIEPNIKQSTPRKIPKIPSNRDYKALNRGTLGGLGIYMYRHAYLFIYSPSQIVRFQMHSTDVGVSNNQGPQNIDPKIVVLFLYGHPKKKNPDVQKQPYKSYKDPLTKDLSCISPKPFQGAHSRSKSEATLSLASKPAAASGLLGAPGVGFRRFLKVPKRGPKDHSGSFQKMGGPNVDVLENTHHRPYLKIEVRL